MPLDCETPLGQLFIQEQYRTQERLAARGYTVINTSGASNNADVILSKVIDGRLTMTGLAEIKSRKTAGSIPLTRKYLSENGGYLITAEKLKFGALASSMYKVPFYVIVSLMEENVILVWQITTSLGDYTEKFETKQTPTRATVNGGTAFRTNAFLKMDSKYLTVIE
jgi:hypothetical protein